MGEHLVAGCETPYVLAKSGDDTSRFDAECQRWLSADVPFAHADDLVPVADPCGAHRDHELVRRGRSRRRELEHAHLAAERVDAGGLHPLHRHLQGSYGWRWLDGGRRSIPWRSLSNEATNFSIPSPSSVFTMSL